MEKQKNSKALVLVIIGMVFAILSLVAFIIAPIYEDSINGWSFVFDGQLWGMYQYGYAPLGLINNIALGLTSLTKFVIWLDDYNGIINIRAILVLIALAAFVVFFILWIIGAGKNKKKKQVAPIILSAISFAISFILLATLFSALDYVFQDQYTYLFDSVLLNTQISGVSFGLVTAATILSGVSVILLLIGALVGMIDSFKKSKEVNVTPLQVQQNVKPLQQPSPKQAPRPAAPQQAHPVAPNPGYKPMPPQQARPVGVRPVQPNGYSNPQYAQRPQNNTNQTGRVGSSNINKKG